MNSKIWGLLGIARRAGKLSYGFDSVLAQIKSGKCHVVVTAADTSEKTAKELRFAAEGKKIPFVRLEAPMKELSKQLGFLKPVGVICLDDRGFAEAVLKRCNLEEDDAK